MAGIANSALDAGSCTTFAEMGDQLQPRQHPDQGSHLFLSLYSIGSIIGVFRLFALLGGDLVIEIIATCLVLLIAFSSKKLSAIK